jgi:hypothetical protein
MRTTNRFTAAVLTGAALLFAGSARLQAQPSGRPLSEQAYERLRAMSDDLDRQAQQANASQRSRSGPYGSDRDLQRAVSNFARRVHGFAARLAGYRARPWPVEDELNGLLADARSIEARIQQPRRRDPRLQEDWDRTVGLLDEMTRISSGRGDRGGYRDRGGPDGSNREGPSYRDDRGNPGGRSSVAGLVSDVSERANRLAERARQLSGPIPADERQRNAWQAIQKLAQDASALGVRIDREGQPRDLRSAVAQLNAEAAEADRQMKAGNIFPEIKTQWADLMQALARLRQSAGA